MRVFANLFLVLFLADGGVSLLDELVLTHDVAARVPLVELLDRGPYSVAPRAARLAGYAALVLWAGIIVSGRLIAYNWFDCDIQPQPAFVNWVAGCVVP